MSDLSGIIFDIQHFCGHDGPGIRSTVFFKGCPLACRWCSNPESQRNAPQLLYYQEPCTACGACVAACPTAAMTIDIAGAVHFRRGACDACGTCVALCPQNARTLSGRRVTVHEVCAEVRQHWRVFMQSGGGVTCSGGEVLAQPEFLDALLHALRHDLGFHTCLETSGYAAWELIESLLASLDLILLDIKHIDPEAHARATGVSNAIVLENARRLAAQGFPVVVRVPLVPGFNDGDADIDALGRFLNETELRSVELLPYHAFGLTKYAALGRRPAAYPGDSRATVIAQMLKSHGLDAAIHSN